MSLRSELRARAFARLSASNSAACARVIGTSGRQQGAHLGQHGLFPEVAGDRRGSGGQDASPATIPARRPAPRVAPAIRPRQVNANMSRSIRRWRRAAIAVHGFVRASPRQGCENQPHMPVHQRFGVRCGRHAGERAKALFGRGQFVALILQPAMHVVDPRQAGAQPGLPRHLLENGRRLLHPGQVRHLIVGVDQDKEHPQGQRSWPAGHKPRAGGAQIRSPDHTRPKPAIPKYGRGSPGPSRTASPVQVVQGQPRLTAPCA